MSKSRMRKVNCISCNSYIRMDKMKMVYIEGQEDLGKLPICNKCFRESLADNDIEFKPGQ